MQVSEGSTLTFLLPDIFRTMNYFPVIRYEHEPDYPLTWDFVDAELIRHTTSSDAPCGIWNVLQTFSLPGNSSSAQFKFPLCLEENQKYEIKLKFRQYNKNETK